MVGSHELIDIENVFAPVCTEKKKKIHVETKQVAGAHVSTLPPPEKTKTESP